MKFINNRDLRTRKVADIMTGTDLILGEIVELHHPQFDDRQNEIVK